MSGNTDSGSDSISSQRVLPDDGRDFIQGIWLFCTGYAYFYLGCFEVSSIPFVGGCLFPACVLFPCSVSLVEEGNVVRLRGLPYEASMKDLSNFLSGLNIIPWAHTHTHTYTHPHKCILYLPTICMSLYLNCVRIYIVCVHRGGLVFSISPVGRRTGEAIVVLETPDQAELAVKRHKFFLRNRYIEVSVCVCVPLHQVYTCPGYVLYLSKLLCHIFWTSESHHA